MRPSDDARKCVVFLGHGSGGAQNFSGKPVGTGFIVAYGVHGDMEYATHYLVTAAHVAMDLDADFCIRFNHKNVGKAELLGMDSVKWVGHPTDAAADVVVIRLDIPTWADVSAYPIGLFVTEFKRATKDIGAGDLAYVVGLFHLLSGKQRNMAIVQTGNVAMMPEETIPGRHWQTKKPIERNAYLVQAPTLPGSSGSPVFVRRSLYSAVLDHAIRVQDDREVVVLNPVKAWNYGSVWLLGLWSGAWFGDPDETIAPPPQPPADLKVPQGMGVVVPAVKIVEIINGPELTKQRNDRAMEIADSMMPISNRLQV